MRSRRNDYQLLLGASGFSARAGGGAGPRVPVAPRRRDLPDRRHAHAGDGADAARRAASRSSKAATCTRAPIDMVVGYSNVDAAREITRYLLEQRYEADRLHRRVPATDNDRARDRRRGYEAAPARRRGARVDPTLCIETDARPRRRRAARWRTLARPPSRRARRVLLGRRARGRRAVRMPAARLAVPGDVAIAGFDDIPIAAQVVPSLTTMRIRATRSASRPAS